VVERHIFYFASVLGLDRKKQDARLGVQGVENDGMREVSMEESGRIEGMIRFEQW
jgi:hypothetical protein